MKDQPMCEMAPNLSPGVSEELEELLLHSARNGDENMVREMLIARAEGKVALNVSCKGKSKSNLGWTPLHLASYFGHWGVAEMLLKNSANVNYVNDAGDTPLHKASFTGREDLVLLLLQHGADVSVINGEGQRPRDVSLSSDVRKLLIAAEQTEIRKKDENLLAATRDGHLEAVSEMLRNPSPPNINCVDSLGNSCLHVAAYRGHKEVAVLLLQNGIDTSLRNHRGQTALELAKDPQTRQVLDVQPLRRLQRTVGRFEGRLVKRARFMGWKPVWAVLERGVLAYFNNRADACSGVHRKDFKYLDGARVMLLETSASTFVIHFSDSTVHRLSVPSVEASELTRQKWIHALQEHIAFSSHYLNQGNVIYDSDEDERDVKPLGSMQDALKNAAAHHGLLQKQLTEATGIMDALVVNANAEGIYGGMLRRMQGLSETAQNMVSTLGHCLTLFQQQEEVRSLQLKQEQEKCRVLEEALHVLAKEHHELEQSVASHLSSPVGSPAVRATAGCTPRFYDTSDDEFYDAFDADTDDGTLVTAASNFSDSDSDTLVSIHSLDASESSTGTLTSPSVSDGSTGAERHPHKRHGRRGRGRPWKSHRGR